MDEVDFTILAAKSVFSDMIEKCPPAETCRDAFDRTAKATIKMASSSGGFGIQSSHQPRRQRRGTMTWTTAPDGSSSSMMNNLSRHRHHRSEQAPFPLDLSLSDNSSSSPGVSAAAAAGQTPPLAKGKALDTDTDTLMGGQCSGPSPTDGMSQDDGSSIDPSLVPVPVSVPVPSPSPPMTRHGAPRGGSGGSLTGQQFGVQGSADYPDVHTMEFLHNLGATLDGDLSGVDQGNIDLGFGINWDGMHNEYGEGQQINPFDTFFFGGQQSGGGGEQQRQQ